MNTIYLVRHAEAEHHVRSITGGWTDTSLTARGVEQSELLAFRLKRLLLGQPVRLGASNLKRSIETADIISKELGVPPEIFPRVDRPEQRHCSRKNTRPGQNSGFALLGTRLGLAAISRRGILAPILSTDLPVHGAPSNHTRRNPGARLACCHNARDYRLVAGNPCRITHPLRICASQLKCIRNQSLGGTQPRAIKRYQPPGSCRVGFLKPLLKKPAQ